MNKHQPKNIKNFARNLRKKSTDCERRLWYFLRNRQLVGFKFNRQYVIGSYIADFVCREKKLIVELDGGQHAEQIEYDRERTRKLKDNGFRVLRFWDDDMLKNKEEVLQVIYQELLNDH